MKNKIIVFGTGAAAKRITRYIDLSKNEILCYADNDTSKHGMKFGNKTIIGAGDIRDYKYDIIIIASSYWKDIKSQLLDIGIHSKNIMCPLAEIKNLKFKSQYKDIYNAYGKMCFYYHKWHMTEQFNPDIAGVLVNPYYFSRKKLYQDVKERAHYLYGKCMDFGCGIQPYRKMLSVDEYVGVEIDMPDKRKDIVYYDGESLPFEDGTFDSIISSEVFEHVVNIQSMVKELNRVLKMNGIFLITVPFVYPKHCWPNDYQRYTEMGLRKLLEDAGFECVEYQTSANYMETVAQLKNVYIYEEVKTKIGAIKILKNILIAVNNIKGILYGKLLPFSDKLYLDNVIVVKKIKNV